MVVAAARPHGHRHQQAARGTDPDDARKQERRTQTPKPSRSCHGLNSPQLFVSHDYPTVHDEPAAGGGGGGEPAGGMSGAAGTAGGGGAAMYAWYGTHTQ